MRASPLLRTLLLALCFALSGASAAQAQQKEIMSGSTLSSGFDAGVASSEGRADWLKDEHGQMKMSYPAGQAWGAVFITVGKPKQPPRPFQDFAAYDALTVEMKGETGGEQFAVGIKSNAQPDDGSETTLPVQLTPTWKTYRFPLAQFVGADLKRLYVPLEFVFAGERAQTVYFRNVAYLRNDAPPPSLTPPPTPTPTPSPTPKLTQHNYALIIGINAYNPAALRPLKMALNDARAVAQTLRNDYGFDIKLLIDDAAGRDQIIGALNDYRRRLTEDDSLLIYYAGHGYRDAKANKAYWLPVDATADDNARWISADDITTAIKVIPARHVLVVSDSCYSGTLTRGVSIALDMPGERTRYLHKMEQGTSRTLMASGSNEPVADAGSGQHSVFANALLHGLREIEPATFTAEQLFYRYIRQHVAGTSEQTPEYNPLRNSGHEDGDFVFVRRH